MECIFLFLDSGLGLWLTLTTRLWQKSHFLIVSLGLKVLLCPPLESLLHHKEAWTSLLEDERPWRQWSPDDSQHQLPGRWVTPSWTFRIQLSCQMTVAAWITPAKPSPKKLINRLMSKIKWLFWSPYILVWFVTQPQITWLYCGVQDNICLTFLSKRKYFKGIVNLPPVLLQGSFYFICQWGHWTDKVWDQLHYKKSTSTVTISQELKTLTFLLLFSPMIKTVGFF